MSPQVQILDVEVGQGTMSVTVNAMPEDIAFGTAQNMYLSVQAFPPDGGNSYGWNDYESLMQPDVPTEVTVDLDLDRQPEGEFMVQAALTNTITGEDAVVEETFTVDGGGGNGGDDGGDNGDGQRNELLQQVVLGAGVAVAATYGYKKFSGN